MGKLGFNRKKLYFCFNNKETSAFILFIDLFKNTIFQKHVSIISSAVRVRAFTKTVAFRRDEFENENRWRLSFFVPETEQTMYSLFLFLESLLFFSKFHLQFSLVAAEASRHLGNERRISKNTIFFEM